LFFLVVAYSKNRWTYFTINTSNDAFSAKDVPFGGEKIKIKYLTDLFDLFEKIEKLQWCLWRKFKIININCHNSGSTQDRVVIFGSMVWFTVSAWQVGQYGVI